MSKIKLKEILEEILEVGKQYNQLLKKFEDTLKSEHNIRFSDNPDCELFEEQLINIIHTETLPDINFLGIPDLENFYSIEQIFKTGDGYITRIDQKQYYTLACEETVINYTNQLNTHEVSAHNSNCLPTSWQYVKVTDKNTLDKLNNSEIPYIVVRKQNYLEFKISACYTDVDKL